MLLAPEVHRSLPLPKNLSRADAWQGMAAWRGQWELRRSQAVAGRLGLSLLEERMLSSFPGSPHGIWRLGRDEWETGRRGLSAGGVRRR
jgi:hypothetical protein